MRGRVEPRCVIKPSPAPAAQVRGKRVFPLQRCHAGDMRTWLNPGSSDPTRRPALLRNAGGALFVREKGGFDSPDLVTIAPLFTPAELKKIEGRARSGPP